MDISKINPVLQFLVSESDEIKAYKRRDKKKEDSIIVSKKKMQDSICDLLETQKAPEFSDVDIENIREKIMNNEYKVDYDRLAEKMLELEKLWLD